MCGVSGLTVRHCIFPRLACPPASPLAQRRSWPGAEGTLPLLRLLKTVQQGDFHRACTGPAAETVSGEDQAGAARGRQGPRAGCGLTRTAMASGRGPLVLRLALASSTTYSHSRPIAVKVLLVVSLPLGLNTKLPVTWFFTAGQGERDTQTSVRLRSTSQTPPGASGLASEPLGAPCLPVTPSHLSPPPIKQAPTVLPTVAASGPWWNTIPSTLTVFPSSCLTNLHPLLRPAQFPPLPGSLL